ncbi:MAG TPA: SDR family oxidoreductase [Ramlibacter sp.]|jgi:NAD(P)-dependent dehydrogenase (short-subunit alcohol dehydrogenase family)|nr:SDR family oxidoreductase [Ramlibacter sp.]
MSTASGRTVLVTGGARRLGRAIALDLAAAGWQVAVHFRGSAEEARKTADECAVHAPADCFAADLADEAQVRALVPQVVARFGRLDAVVNNASRFEHDDALTFGFAGFTGHMLANAAGPVLLAQLLAAHVQERDAQGAVVNLLDQKLWNPNPDFLSYTLSKAALESATTVLAQALAPRLRVVGVAPGLTLTSQLLSQEKFEELHKLSPLGRSSRPEDVAHAVRFALENPAITGTTLLVDGGQHLMKFDRDFSLM